MTRLARVLWIATALVVGVALAGVVYFVASTIAVRVPYWGEAEVVFEASRLRQGLPLFVDPLVGAGARAGAGAWGEPASRWTVTYPPLLTWVVARVPAGAALLFGRALATLGWLGALAGLAVTARKDARGNAWLAAAYVAGLWGLANFATVGRPDSVACALAAIGLARALRMGRVDAVSAAILALVPWVKPTVVGVPLGAIAGDLLARRRAALPAVAVAAAVALVVGIAVGTETLRDVFLSNAQPLELGVWLDNVPARLPFYAAPIALAAYFAARDKNAIALGALGAATAFALVGLAKVGSASNYWMESCVCAVAVVARSSPGAFRFGDASVRNAGLALAAALYADVASVRASFEHAASERERAAFVGTLRDRCGLVASDEAGVELAVDDRILVPAFQFSWLVRRGRFPVGPWIATLDAPRVGCVVERTGQMRDVPALARAIDERFPVRTDAHGFRLNERGSTPRPGDRSAP